jgi:hypothetical protein
MARIRLRYVHEYVEPKTGKAYRYFRRRGYPVIRLPGLPGSLEFMEAYGTALRGEPPPSNEPPPRVVGGGLKLIVNNVK